MKKIFTLLVLSLATFITNAQIDWQGSFEQDGFGPVGTSVNGTGSFANAGITNTDTYWLNVWSIDSKNTKVTIVDDASDGTQAFLFEIGETTTDIRMRTDADAVNYVNGDFVKVTVDAKTDQAGVDAGGKLISVVKNTFTKELTTSYATYDLYGAIANNRIQIWFPSTAAGESYKVWIDNVTVEKVDAIPVEPVDPEFTSFPFTDDFEAAEYVVGNTLASYDGVTESDSWAVNNLVFDRFWRGTNTNEYYCTVDADAYSGSKCMKMAVTNKAGLDIKLRTVNIAEGFYDISFYAKTDVAGEGTAKLGILADETTWSNLTATYTLYEGIGEVVANPSNGTTRLIIFYTAGASEPEGVSYNIWIDDINIAESSATTNHSISQERMNIYPNPVTDNFSIKTTGDIDNIEIFSLAGVNVLQTNHYNGSIDISNLPRGMYIVTATINGKTVQQKITKR